MKCRFLANLLQNSLSQVQKSEKYSLDFKFVATRHCIKRSALASTMDRLPKQNLEKTVNFT